MADPRRPDLNQGVFETLLVIDGRPVEIEPHLSRLRASLEELFPDRVAPALEDGLRARASGAELGAMRVTVAPDGDASLRAKIETRSARGDFLSLSDRNSPRREAALHSFRLSGGLGAHKWADRSLLDAAQAELPVDALPLIVEADGSALEASRANVFAVRNGALVTPPVDGRILPGVTRMRVLKLAAALEIDAREGELSREDLLSADEVFLTGSVRGIEQARSLDGAELAKEGSVGSRLAAELRRTWTAVPVG